MVGRGCSDGVVFSSLFSHGVKAGFDGLWGMHFLHHNYSTFKEVLERDRHSKSFSK